MPLFRRGSAAAASSTTTVSEDKPVAQQTKGRATPSRKDAEAARKQTLKIPSDPKAAKAAARQRARTERTSGRAALASGDERNLPARDAGPVKAYIRELVDGRRSAGEYFIPVAVVVLVLGFVKITWLQQLLLWVWLVMLIGIVLDMTLLTRRLRQELATRFPDSSHKGATTYAMMRSIQIRRLRLPKPKIKAGGAPVVPKVKP